MTTEPKPRFSEDPRGGTFIDDGTNPVYRVEDAPAETPTPVVEQTPEVATDGR